MLCSALSKSKPNRAQAQIFILLQRYPVFAHSSKLRLQIRCSRTTWPWYVRNNFCAYLIPNMLRGQGHDAGRICPSAGASCPKDCKYRLDTWDQLISKTTFGVWSLMSRKDWLISHICAVRQKKISAFCHQISSGQQTKTLFLPCFETCYRTTKEQINPLLCIISKQSGDERLKTLFPVLCNARNAQKSARKNSLFLFAFKRAKEKKRRAKKEPFSFKHRTYKQEARNKTKRNFVFSCESARPAPSSMRPLLTNSVYLQNTTQVSRHSTRPASLPEWDQGQKRHFSRRRNKENIHTGSDDFAGTIVNKL